MSEVSLILHYRVSYLLTTITTIALAAFLLLRKRREPNVRLFAIFLLSIAWWSFSDIHLITTSDHRTALFWAQIGTIGVFWIPSLFLHFVLNYLKHAGQARRLIGGIHGSSLLWALLAPTPLLVCDVQNRSATATFDVVPGPLYPLATAFFFACASYGTFLLYQGYLYTTDSHLKESLRYLLIGTAIGYGGGTLNFLPVFGIEIDWLNSFATYSIPLYVLITCYAIIRHQFMDITVVIRKTAVYSMLVAAITLIYMVVVLVTERSFQNLLGYHSLPMSILTAILIALLFQPLKNLIQRFVDCHLFKAPIDQLAEQAARLQQELVRTDQLRAVGTFAAGMAHEIKNPLATIKTFVEHLSSQGHDPEFRQRFERLVGQEVTKIDRLVKEVLEFTRPAPLQLHPVELDRLCDEVLEFLQPQILRQRVTVTRLYTDRGACRADRTQLKQALLNLILNSLEAMPDGGALTIGVSRQNNALAVTIHDTGPGIPPEIMQRLAEPFVTSKEHGTGLGLAIVQTIVQAHGGWIDFQSIAGSGTTVTIQIPGKRQKESESLPSQPRINSGNRKTT